LNGSLLRPSNEHIPIVRVPGAKGGHQPMTALLLFFSHPLNNGMRRFLSPLRASIEALLGRAIREHRERTVLSHNSRTMMMNHQPFISDALEEICG
jgi:hypothetical protein